MSIISKTKFAILQELSKQPLHGYALVKKLKITVSSVYAHLSELEQYGGKDDFEMRAVLETIDKVDIPYKDDLLRLILAERIYFLSLKFLLE